MREVEAMNIKATSKYTLILVGLFLMGINSVLAQDTVRLKGRISDSSGGAIEKLQIIVENSSGRFEAITNDNGEYDLVLPPGTYKVSTKKIPGFAPYNRNKVRIKPGKDKILNVKLRAS
jgi:hypothetical protein